MIGSSNMYFRPYLRACEQARGGVPYITRLIPRPNGFALAFLDEQAPRQAHTLLYRATDAGTWERQALNGLTVTVDGLEKNQSYACAILRADGALSRERIVKTGETPPDAVIVDYLHPDDPIFEFSGRALGAPSLVRAPSGALLATDCVFCDRNAFPALPNLSRLLRSEDEGAHWHYVCDLLPSFNGSLFFHRDRLYFLTLDGDYCNLVITASEDEGESWSPPVTLFRGESAHRFGWHSSAMPMLEHERRLYKAIEFGHVAEYGTDADAAPAGAWTKNGLYFDLSHHVGVLSVDADADLLCAEAWRMSELYDPKDVDPYQCIEGNIVEQDGALVNILRTMRVGVSLQMSVAPDPERVMHSPVVLNDFPLSAVSKFEIKRDPQSKAYVALGNDCRYKRKRLVMAVSDDLRDWRIACEIADARETDNAFSYPDFIFSGNDILLLSRTAYNGAKNNHDTNMITFHRIKDFRRYLSKSIGE